MSQPNNERIIEIVATQEEMFRNTLTELIAAKATPETLSRIIHSWEVFKSSIDCEPKSTGAAMRGGAVAGAMIGAGIRLRRTSDNPYQMLEDLSPEEIAEIKARLLHELSQNRPSIELDSNPFYRPAPEG